MDVTLEEVLKCGICLDRFEQPRLLPCGHTFCLPCLRNFDRSFTCPTCRANHSLPRNGAEKLPINFALVQLLDARTQEKGFVEARFQSCGEREGQIHECDHCKCLLCHNCLRRHLVIVAKELQKSTSQVKDLLPSIEQRISDIKNAKDQVKMNGDAAKKKVDQWIAQVIDALKWKQIELHAKVDDFAKNETGTLQMNVETLESKISGMKSHCEDAEKMLSKSERNPSIPSTDGQFKKMVDLLGTSEKYIKDNEIHIGTTKRVTSRTIKFSDEEGQLLINSLSEYGCLRAARGGQEQREVSPVRPSNEPIDQSSQQHHIDPLQIERLPISISDEISAEMDRKIKTKSIKRTIVGTKGGSVENFGCKSIFPPQAFDKDTEVQTSVITDLSDCPEDKMPIAPIIECGPPGRLNRPARLEIEHWASPAGGDVYAEVFRKDNEELKWKFVEKVRIVLHQPIIFHTNHFTLYEFVINRATSILGGIRQCLFQYTLQNLVYISGVDQSLACVCCLKNSKVMDDITQTLKNAHYQPLLPAPETTFAERGEDVKITIRCIEPDNLTIRVGENLAVRRIEKIFPVSIIATKCKEFRYLPITLENGDLKEFDGVLRFRYSHTAGEDNIQHPLQKVWPIPVTSPIYVLNTFGPIRTGTILGADPNEHGNQLVRH